MLCVEEILYLIEIRDLIRISYLSKRTHRIIKSLKSAITDLRVFELGEEFLLQFYIKEKFESVGNIRVNNGLELRNKKSLSPTVVLSWKKRVIDYMTQLFKIPVLILIIYSDKISDVCLENIIFDQECQDLTIHGKRPINNGTLEKVFELSKSKRIIMHVPIKPGFQLDTEKMKGRNISIKDGSWLNYKRDNKFMELCTNFELMDDHFVTPFRFASFVDKWIRSDDKHFENCLVTWTNITVDDVDFRNFPFIPFDRSQRSQTYKYNKKLAIDLAEGYDILRGDGTLATIGILEDGFFFGIVQCQSYYDKNCLATLSLDYFGLMYEYPTCNKDMKNGFDSPLVVLGPLAAFVFTIVLNLITFGKIMHFYVGNKSMDSENLVAVKNNIRLFFQTVLQDSLFFIDMLFTFKLSSLSDGRVWALISQMLVWESIHMLDGFIMLMFSNRLSILKSKIFKSNQNNVDRRMFQIGRSSNTLPEVA
ncbi:hypothetical protein L5515_006118 [Caenorhabditis briggsae]|uniref:7TM GPCR serpentine receptor class x (Srx) domain-containing protein n=1 Tax=Caenorhabditis briggsae TaxID=6238 RepID=A0AAE9F0X4_CAEBR|nr:hypothetical protein L5515_006118 [Caenorhabditis briggsae]